MGSVSSFSQNSSVGTLNYGGFEGNEVATFLVSFCSFGVSPEIYESRVGEEGGKNEYCGFFFISLEEQFKI